MIKILVLFFATSLMDSEGWVSVERPSKIPYQNEEWAGADSETPQWVAFAKQTGLEKVLVSFPSIPVYLYGDEGLIVAGSWKDTHFQFEIRERVFETESALLQWRLGALAGKDGIEKYAYLSQRKEPVIELLYWNGKSWVFEWWKSTDQNTYAQITESPTKNDDFHRQFLATFDLELDQKMTT